MTATKEDRPFRPRVLPDWVDICLSAAAAPAELLYYSPESITTNGNNKAKSQSVRAMLNKRRTTMSTWRLL